MTIKNRETIVEQLTAMLMQFDKDANTFYQTDVYLYYNAENQEATLDTFVNVGGNSWLDDDHYTIYTDKEHYDDGIWSWYQSEEELAMFLEIPLWKLRDEVIAYQKLDADEAEDYNLTYSDAAEYIKTRDDYVEKLTNGYFDYIDENESDFVEKANWILDEFEKEQTYIEAEEAMIK